MRISEIFQSINGESCFSGLRTVFVRAHGCNLRCSYCFGVKPGRVDPCLRIGYYNTSYRGNHNLRLTSAKEGDWIMTYNDDLELVETQIVELKTRQVLEWYEIKIDGTLYYITPEHPVFTVNGLKRVEELVVGDQIIECDPNKYLSYMSSVRNCMENPDVVRKCVDHTDHTVVSKKVSAFRQSIFAQIHDLIGNQVPLKDWPDKCIQFYNTYMTEKSPEIRKRISDSKKGDKNPNWNPNAVHRPNYELLKEQVRQGDITKSQLSGRTLEEDNAKMFHVHHIDGNPDNDDWSNLIVVTSKEHNQIHQRGYSFWKGERKDGKRLSTVFANNGKEVQSIKYVNIANHKYLGKYYGPKPLTVYTLKCAPYNTYLIDNMWVHNCDSMYSVEGDDFKEMSVDEIIEEVERYNCRRVTFTGGEPLCQKDALELIEKLASDNYIVEIETNGAVNLSDLVKLRETKNLTSNIVITMDWKCPTSGMCDKMLVGNLFRLDPQDVIKCVVGSKDDLDEAAAICTHKTAAQIYISPVFGQIELEDIANYIIGNKINRARMQLQMHKIIWDKDKRGV